MSALMRLAAAGHPTPVTYVEDVFSAYTYKGNDTAGRSINNGVDLADKGGLVWTKVRSNTYSHYLYDTTRGTGNYLESNTTSGNAPFATGLTAFNSNGYTIGNSSGFNSSANEYVSWTFRKAPKFFDVVTWTGNGANRTISHSLGSVPGMIVVKLTSSTSNWHVYHQSIANTEYLLLNTTAAKATDATLWNSSTATSSVFSLGTNASVNQSGQTYVAYLFAHDTGTDGIIQCGSFTTDVSGNATVTLGWEPQYLMVKSSVTATFNDWLVIDSSREFSVNSSVRLSVKANTADAESSYSGGAYQPNATGFKSVGSANTSATLVYLAIRRPNKPPTVGTQVYNASLFSGTSTTNTRTIGFAPDLIIDKSVSNYIWSGLFMDRLRGLVCSDAGAAGAEVAFNGYGDLTSFNMLGMTYDYPNVTSMNTTTSSEIGWCFKRAPGVFDVVCYTGTGVAKTEAHNLGAAPQLMIVKSRGAIGTAWEVYYGSLTTSLQLNSTTSPISGTADWGSTYPTSTVFTVGSAAAVNNNTSPYVAYLFATKSGISKVGSYTGNGSSQTINCGFTTGARFVLIKCTSTSGDWFVWDTTRGISAGDDPHLSINTYQNSVTDDSIDPDTSGFIVNQLAATNINVTSATYIYLAFA